jgi:hypothetical protein
LADQATVCKIRPVSWKICVQGEEAANYVRGFLSGKRFECSTPEPEPELHDPPTYSIIATPQTEAPLTAEEIQSLLQQDDKIELSFTE